MRFNYYKKSDIEKVISEWGDKQKPLIIEELAELIVALKHFERGKITKEELISEVADVEIMLMQLKILYSIDVTDIHNEIKFKLKRTLEKI